jgi:hypothetical protein
MIMTSFVIKEYAANNTGLLVLQYVQVNENHDYLSSNEVDEWKGVNKREKYK